MNKRMIAIYLRVSTEEQARHGYGLGDQEEKCKKYVELYYPETEKVEIFKDDGYSAKNLKRPQMTRMMKLLEEGKIKIIVVYKLDRLSRNVIDTYQLLSDVVKYDCNLCAVVDKLDISSANGRMLVGVLSVIAQWEREVISERTLAGMSEMVRKGKYPYSHTPFGFKKSKDKYLGIDVEEKKVFDFWVDSLCKGYCLDEISEMSELLFGITRHPAQISRILKRSINIGIFNYKGSEYKNIAPSLMTLDKYTSVCKMLNTKKIKAPQRSNYIYYDLIHCTNCGHKLSHTCTIKKNKTYYYYYCENCDHRINQNIISRRILNRIIKEYRERDLNKENKLIESRIGETEHELETFFKRFNKGELDVITYNFSIKMLSSQKEALEKQLEIKKVNNVQLFTELDTKQQYELIHDIVEKINIRFKENNRFSINIVYRK